MNGWLGYGSRDGRGSVAGELAPLLVPEAKPVKLTLGQRFDADPEVARLTTRIMLLTGVLIVVDFATFAFSATFDTGFGVSTFGGLLASLLLPLCGYHGVRTSDRPLICCFWSWALVFFMFHLFTLVLLLVWLFNVFKWWLVGSVLGNLMGSVLLWLSFNWGKELHEKPYWDPLTGPEAAANLSRTANIVDAASDPVLEAKVVLGQPSGLDGTWEVAQVDVDEESGFLDARGSPTLAAAEEQEHDFQGIVL